MAEAIEIIPAVIPKSLDELKAAIETVEPHCAWLHVDVMDGVFVPNTTIQDPLLFHQLETKLKIEAHLMVVAKPNVRNAWFDSPAERLIWHIEAFDSPDEAQRTVESTKAIGKQVGLALNPETPISAVEPYLDKLDTVLIMSVNPGFAGQKFDESVIPKIVSLRQKWPSGIISVDGGIRVGTARQVVAAGAGRLIAGSALFGAEDFGEALRSFREDARERILNSEFRIKLE
ncbi:ribulose-phosphate 3-epimerase [Candidatus Parcubacteria bacterium]|nr:ribulose-phosphate 3-epimerase [Candidatus Parcubacteria bacterium]